MQVKVYQIEFPQFNAPDSFKSQPEKMVSAFITCKNDNEMPGFQPGLKKMSGLSSIAGEL
jgi:hypothetical protein